MKCEFEEKQFEGLLNYELMCGRNFLYVPGQVTEGLLGFDAGIFSTHSKFWGYFVNLPRQGISISKTWWQNLEQDLEHFPPFKYNLFIQHKNAN